MYIARKPENQKKKETHPASPMDTRSKVMKTKPLNEIPYRTGYQSPARTQSMAATPVKQQNLPSYLTETWSMEDLKRSEESAIHKQAVQEQRSQRAKERYETYANSLTNTDYIDFMDRRPGDAERLEQESKRLWDDWKRLEKASAAANQELWAIQARIQKMEKNPRITAYYTQGTAVLDAHIAAAKAEEARLEQYRAKVTADYNTLVNDSNAQMGSWTREKEAAAQALLAEMQRSNDEYNAVFNDRRTMEDVLKERKYAQIISKMNDVDFLLLELTQMSEGDRIQYLNKASEETKKQLRARGEMNLTVTEPQMVLKKRGYSNEELEAICDTYERIQNEVDMYALQVQTAQKASKNPIGTTLSTYPTKLVGDVSGDLTALMSNIGSDWGLSTYSTMDVNHPGFRPSEYVSTTRDTVSSNLAGSARMAYEVGNDAVDSLVKDEVGKLVGMPWLAVTGEYGEKARKAVEYGGTTEQSNALGLGSLGVAGAKEVVSEMLDQTTQYPAKAISAGVKAAIEYGGKQKKQAMLYEQTEYARRVNELIKDGMERKDAEEQAYYQMLLGRRGKR